MVVDAFGWTEDPWATCSFFLPLIVKLNSALLSTSLCLTPPLPPLIRMKEQQRHAVPCIRQSRYKDDLNLRRSKLYCRRFPFLVVTS